VKNKWKNGIDIQAVGDAVGQTQIDKMGVVDDLSAFFNAVRFFVVAPEVAVRFEVAVTRLTEKLALADVVGERKVCTTKGGTTDGSTFTLFRQNQR
jgi:hypothetical protein